jgi:putative spermidine/putrescine transport system permease protein
VSNPVTDMAARAPATLGRVTRRRIAFQIVVVVSVVIGIAIMVIPLAMTIVLAASSGPLLTLPIPGLSVMPYVKVLQYPGYLEAVVRSVGLAVVIVVISGVIGTITAIAGRSLTGRSARVFQTAVLAPVVFPSLALGLALFEWFAVIKLRAGLLPLFLGHLVLATPFVIRTVLAGLDHLDPELEKAARSLGARRWYALRRVTLPLLIPSLLSAGVFAFWISFDNFTISFFFGSPTTRLIPVQLLVMASSVVDPRLAAGATLLLVVSVPLILLLRMLSSVQMMRNM